MKKLRTFCVLLFVVLMATSCTSDKPTPAATQDSTEELLPSETPTSEAFTTSASAYVAEIDPNSPFTFRVYVLPNEERLTAIILECGAKSYPISTPSNGVDSFNHCFLNTVSDSAAIVLPDGNTVFISPHSSLQVNLSESEDRLFLKKGEIISFLSTSGKRKFSVLAGDKAIQISDGIVAAHQKDDVLTVATYYYTNEPVSVQRCSSWQTIDCQKWESPIASLSADEAVIGTIGSDDWQHVSGQESNDAVDLPFSTTILESYIYDSGILVGEASNDLTQYFNMANESIQNYFVNQFLAMGIDGNDYNQMIYKSNLDPSISLYCTDFPQTCDSPEELATPEWAEALDPTDESESGSSGGNPSGKFPEFDRGSCFSRDGHEWCFPKPGTVDVTMSAEWDLTAICLQYPGETFCAWSEVQSTLH